MPLTDDLCRSWLDLLEHFDPTTDAAAGGVGAAATRRLGCFERNAVRGHLAAGRAIAAAVEELPVEEVADEIDRTALLGEIRAHLSRFEFEQPHVRNPVFWLDHLVRALAPPLDRGDATGLHDTVATLQALPEYLTAARETLKRPPAVLSETATEMIPGLVALIHQLVEFLRVEGAEDPGELAAAATEAEAALARLRIALTSELAPDEDPYAVSIGEERYGWLLHQRDMLRQSAGEVWRWGQAIADEVETEVAALAATFDQDRHWRDVFETVREAGLVTGDLAHAAAVALAHARELTWASRLFTPREGEIAVLEAPRAAGALTPFAHYQPPAGTRSGQLLLATPTAPADRDAATWGRGELDRHRLAVLAVHDGWPGRHLQALASRDTGSLVRRELRSHLVIAGWGCYAEELMLEHGAFEAPGDRLAQRVLLLIRAMRVVVDAGIHSRQLTPAAALDLFMERVPLDHSVALAEIRRAAANPGHGAAYALGRRELLELRDDWRAATSGGAPLRDFHEQVLSFGRIPPSLVRWGMGVG